MLLTTRKDTLSSRDHKIALQNTVEIDNLNLSIASAMQIAFALAATYMYGKAGVGVLFALLHLV